MNNSLGTCAGGRRAIICSTFLARRLRHTLRLLKSVMFRSAFPRRRVRGRARIVVSRVRSCRSGPSRLVFSSFRSVVFHGRPLKEGVLKGPRLLEDFHARSILSFAHQFCRPKGVIFFIRKRCSFGGVVHLTRGCVSSVPTIRVRGHHAPPPLCVPRRLAMAGSARRTRMVVNDHKCGTCSSGHATLCLLGGVLNNPKVGDGLGISLHRHEKLICGIRSGLASCASANTFYVCFKASVRSVSAYLGLACGRLGQVQSIGVASSRLTTTGGRLVKRVKITSSGFRGGTLNVTGAFLRCRGCRSSRLIFGHVRTLATRALLRITGRVFTRRCLSALVCE